MEAGRIAALHLLRTWPSLVQLVPFQKVLSCSCGARAFAFVGQSFAPSPAGSNRSIRDERSRLSAAARRSRCFSSSSVLVRAKANDDRKKEALVPLWTKCLRPSSTAAPAGATPPTPQTDPRLIWRLPTWLLASFALTVPRTVLARARGIALVSDRDAARGPGAAGVTLRGTT